MSHQIDIAALYRLARCRTEAFPGDREVLADYLLDMGRDDMAAAIRAGRPWRTFLDCVIAVQPESDQRGPTLGTWFDGEPIQWDAAAETGPWYVTIGEGRDERPLELRWELHREEAILAKRKALLALVS